MSCSPRQWPLAVHPGANATRRRASRRTCARLPRRLLVGAPRSRADLAAPPPEPQRPSRAGPPIAPNRGGAPRAWFPSLQWQPPDQRRPSPPCSPHDPLTPPWSPSDVRVQAGSSTAQTLNVGAKGRDFVFPRLHFLGRDGVELRERGLHIPQALRLLASLPVNDSRLLTLSRGRQLCLGGGARLPCLGGGYAFLLMAHGRTESGELPSRLLRHPPRLLSENVDGLRQRTSTCLLPRRQLGREFLLADNIQLLTRRSGCRCRARLCCSTSAPRPPCSSVSPRPRARAAGTQRVCPKIRFDAVGANRFQIGLRLRKKRLYPLHP
eukprot:scaffold79875_cov23-Tisochrysis_lutea.AAC.3